jgi:hypothetical protein
MTLAQITALIAANIDTTGRRLTTGVKMRQVLDGIVAYLSAPAVQVKVAAIELSASQINNTFTSPVAFGLTPASGTTLIPISACAYVVYGGTAFDTVTRLQIRAVGQTDALFGSANGLLSQTSNVFGVFTATARNFAPTTDFEVFNPANPQNGNGTAKVYLHYIEVPI